MHRVSNCESGMFTPSLPVQYQSDNERRLKLAGEISHARIGQRRRNTRLHGSTNTNSNPTSGSVKWRRLLASAENQYFCNYTGGVKWGKHCEMLSGETTLQSLHLILQLRLLYWDLQLLTAGCLTALDLLILCRGDGSVEDSRCLTETRRFRWAADTLRLQWWSITVSACWNVGEGPGFCPALTLLVEFTAFPPHGTWSPTFTSFWKEWVLFNCTWYLFSIAQLLYLQDQELQTWLFKCYMCTSGVLSWHFLLFSFPFVHSHAFRVSHYEFQTFQFH